RSCRPAAGTAESSLTLVITGLVLADCPHVPARRARKGTVEDAHAPAVAAPSTRSLPLRDHRVVRPARGDHVRLRRQRGAPARPELRTGPVRAGLARVG